MPCPETLLAIQDTRRLNSPVVGSFLAECTEQPVMSSALAWTQHTHLGDSDSRVERNGDAAFDLGPCAIVWLLQKQVKESAIGSKDAYVHPKHRQFQKIRAQHRSSHRPS